jgi:glycosyltransferase involved in cell wall biosynthesis
LEPRVQWTGRLPDAGVSEALAVCDALLMPYEDGASLRRGTLMAGLAHGCAIVTTVPATPLPELEEGRDLLTIPVGDDAAAAAALQRIAADAQLAATLRDGALAAARRFTWEEIARRHDELYTSLAV